MEADILFDHVSDLERDRWMRGDIQTVTLLQKVQDRLSERVSLEQIVQDREILIDKLLRLIEYVKEVASQSANPAAAALEEAMLDIDTKRWQKCHDDGKLDEFDAEVELGLTLMRRMRDLDDTRYEMLKSRADHVVNVASDGPLLELAEAIKEMRDELDIER